MSLAPAATRDGWSYSGELHVEASNNRHRRATLPELKAVFDGSDGAKDRPAHWYEAQLIHYGLPPSKTKGTAKMRLWDAVSQGSLAVPGHILKTEAELKREWTKRDREAKQALKKLVAPIAATAAKTPNKRKAEDGYAGVASGTNVNINLSVSVGAQGHVQVGAAGAASKKAKTGPTATKSAVTKSAVAKSATTKSTPAKATPAKATPAKSTPAKATRTKATPAKATPAKATSAKATPAKATPAKPASAKALPAKPTPATRKPQTARRGTSSAPSSRPAPPPFSSEPANPQRQTARCSRPYNRAVPGRAAPPSPSNEPAVPQRQTARRSRPFNPAGQGRPIPAAALPPPRFDATPAQWDNVPDDPPPPYPGSGYDDDGYDDDGYDDDEYDDVGYDDDQDALDGGGGTLAPLGLLNGRYRLSCTAPPEFAGRGDDDSGIIFTLDGNALWGSFEIGPLSGILRLAERPWASSRQRLYFEWRGEDEQGGDHVKANDGSYIVFLGGGVLVGGFVFYGEMLEFEGKRVSGQETRSEVSAGDMRREWESRR